MARLTPFDELAIQCRNFGELENLASVVQFRRGRRDLNATREELAEAFVAARVQDALTLARADLESLVTTRRQRCTDLDREFRSLPEDQIIARMESRHGL